jgi:hypothetical protein
MSVVINGTGSISGLSNVGGIASAQSGSVIQVVQSTYSTQSSTTSTTPVDTGLSATITPQFSNSKILAIVTMSAQSYVTSGNARDTGGAFTLVRTASTIWGNYTTVNFYIDGGTSATLSFNLISTWGVNYLDSPATTSATTYTIQYACASGRTMVVNPSSASASVLTLMEIAA